MPEISEAISARPTMIQCKCGTAVAVGARGPVPTECKPCAKRTSAGLEGERRFEARATLLDQALSKIRQLEEMLALAQAESDERLLMIKELEIENFALQKAARSRPRPPREPKPVRPIYN